MYVLYLKMSFYRSMNAAKILEHCLQTFPIALTFCLSLKLVSFSAHPVLDLLCLYPDLRRGES